VNPIDPKHYSKILIRGTNWVGDAVMSIPALREIRRIFGHARISLLVRSWVKDVYAKAEFVDRVLEFDNYGRHAGWSGRRRLADELQSEGFELAILLQNAFEAALITWRARIPRRLGYARDARSLLLTDACRIEPEVRKVHQAFYYLGILYGARLLPTPPWEVTDYPLSARIGVTETDRDSARAMMRAGGAKHGQLVIALNPGASYGGAKRWLTDRYAVVANELTRRYEAHVILVGAAAESGLAHEIARQMSPPPAILTGKTTLGQLMGVLVLSSLLVTNDSGPMHLAAALDVPQVAIFGSTSETATGPLSDRAEIVKHPVDCNPCFLRECPIDFRCMTGLTTDMVVLAAVKKLEGSDRRFEG